jgi:hypothetical protein
VTLRGFVVRYPPSAIINVRPDDIEFGVGVVSKMDPIISVGVARALFGHRSVDLLFGNRREIPFHTQDYQISNRSKIAEEIIFSLKEWVVKVHSEVFTARTPTLRH